MWFFLLWVLGLLGFWWGGVFDITAKESFWDFVGYGGFYFKGLYYNFSVVYFNSELNSVCLVFLSFGVCEAALGLSVLVSLVRSTGSDYVSGLVSGHF
uniref:NADH-ubiquinone oxidoreductase chain 4L n=1 Tax=Quadrula quadrula TaxID=52372 RepID=D2DVY7_QUAQU|nr:NADH dehydrogenase subunit 4L [Quadrula quadrula]ACQ91014.1 NADH dehydrogenase subunit 4L [Quadrula quadrula]